jgi:L-ascorbate metabolism protein UlaG (beta-lactamase superfamily)
MAVEWVDPKVAIPMHYNTWPPIEQDPQVFADEVAKRCNAKVRILGVGETAEL